MNKKAVSELIGYVLLIVIAISIGLLVFSWLKGYILVPEKTCPEGMSITIQNYFCDNQKINITLKNTGNFNIDGYLARISNTSEGKAIYFLQDLNVAGGYLFKNQQGIENFFNNKEGVLKPEEEYEVQFSFSDYKRLTRIEIQPFKIMDKQIILCKDQIIKQELSNCPRVEGLA